MITTHLDIRDQGGSTLATFLMDDPHITYRLSDKSGFSTPIAFSTPGLTQDIFGPKRTDYRIKISTDGGTTFEPTQGGFCWVAGLKTEEYAVQLEGVDFLAWLDQPYHFAAYDDWAGSGNNDKFRYWVDETQQQIITDLLDGMFDGTGNTINLTPVFSGPGWTNVLSYSIQIGDTSNVIDMIKAVGAFADPYGFDFKIDHYRTVFFTSPHIAQAESAVPFVLYAPSFETGLIDIDWQNNGPLATSSVAFPTPKIVSRYEYAPSVAMFRKWLEIVELNDTIKTSGNFNIQRAVDDVGGLHSNPQKENTITVDPELMNPFDPRVGFFNQCGRIVDVDSEDHFMPYHRIDAPYRITQQELYKENKAWRCRLTLDQLY